MTRGKKRIWIVFAFSLMIVGLLGLCACHGRVKTSRAKGDEMLDANGYLVSLEQKEAGDVIERERIDWNALPQYFTAQKIDDTLRNEMVGKSYSENEAISLEELRYIKVLHYNYKHEIQVGELVVNKKISDDCLAIFRELFENGYEIHSMYLIDRYYVDGNVEDAKESADYNSVNNNNTSGFNYRDVAGTDVLSAHALGMAIDINPLENPSMCLDEDGNYSNKYLQLQDYSDRSILREHMISTDDLCYQIFVKHGFCWGGEWDGPADYQHFEKVE